MSSEIIDLNEKPLLLRWTFAHVWIGGEELELATCDKTDRPMVIHWASNRAWVGNWDALVAPIAKQLEVSHGGTHRG
ncbi:MAG: hypothetical protein CL543_09170 [Alcanivorax sp.]|nr:hypothetical protein [Alcanivorax sp.]MAY12021.1 hypothetical protein [Alcanivorax sp.]MBI55623.1 hypothetical protein [Alcanivorax sp.]MBU59038.1 hypothetical protein [Alcanivorax sp.]|tara:strand:- start:138 stop:368 length:231 start_codon:yes stop_codon:yes gene_type:complete